VILKKVTREQAEEILFDPEIFSRCSGGESVKNFKLQKGLYIGGFIKNKIFGIVTYYDRRDFSSIHINVLKDYRARYGAIFGKKALIYNNGKPLYTNIPEEFEDVIRFVEFFGFELVGKYKNQLVYRRG